MTVVERIVALCCRFPWAVIVACLLLGGGAAWYTSQNFAMNTDSEQLIDAKVGWRMRQARFDADFPQQSNITVAVIDGATPELAESAAARLTERLAANPKLFTHVRRPDGGAFFNQNGLLFLPLKEVQSTTQQLIKAQPFLGSLAADPQLARDRGHAFDRAARRQQRRGQARRSGCAHGALCRSVRGGRQGRGRTTCPGAR